MNSTEFYKNGNINVKEDLKIISDITLIVIHRNRRCLINRLLTGTLKNEQYIFVKLLEQEVTISDFKMTGFTTVMTIYYLSLNIAQSNNYGKKQF